MEKRFKLVSSYGPTGDQPAAIDALVRGLNSGYRHQTLMGVTGSGKTFTIANVIERVQRPTLVIAHNKTLAAQLCSELREFFPENAVEYFVSLFDYYQPEAYIPHTDTYIEKEATINDEIDRLRHRATSSLFERRDVVIVASVSCIYGLGSPEEYRRMMLPIKRGDIVDRDKILRRLVGIQYIRSNAGYRRGTFRARGDVIEIIRPYGESAVRVEMFGDEIDRIVEVDMLTGEILKELDQVGIYPASHYVTTKDRITAAVESIEAELEARLEELRSEGKLLEAQRLEQRTRYDMEMLLETGFCQGIENYSRHLDGRAPGDTPATLIDYFPDDFVVVIDESHMTVPQLHAMYAGDRSRKEVLVRYGFRLPSALDNRPLTFEEFSRAVNQVVYVSATPGDYELKRSSQVVEQIIRPTGLVDPEITVRPTRGQIDDLIAEIKDTTARGYRTLVTTLTRKMAEDLTDYLIDSGLRVKYLHYEVDTLERVEIVRDLRLGKFDVIVGINLLREGLDLPEVELVAILDADKEGFLRSNRSLIQTIGRAARNVNGRVIMYADQITESMRSAIDETNRRRSLQSKYNQEHGIIPKSIVKAVAKGIGPVEEEQAEARPEEAIAERLGYDPTSLKETDILELIDKLDEKMRDAAANLEFEEAAKYRDEIAALRRRLLAHE
ncbi:MAG: excinuclease ABC subunit UvrB [Firmicutes bacterium]|nr:excinuclease ABC subunit UvrB [Bacillota bacterium]